VNDFLDNLAERAMNNERGVQPRMPSLFDPAAPVAPWPPMAEASESEPYEVAVDREADVPAAIKSVRQTQLHRLERNEKLNESPALTSVRHQSLLSMPLEARPDQQNLLSPAMATPQPRSSLSADRSDAEGGESVIRRIVNKPVIQPSSASTHERRDVKDRPARVSSLIAPPAQNHQRVETNVQQIEANIGESTNTENQSSFIVRPMLDHYSEPPAPRPQANTQAQSVEATTERVINVTIGRIEVRATPPPPGAAARSNNQKPPVMSLDDYLRQRSGGRGGGV
jgi:hypothetical protein